MAKPLKILSIHSLISKSNVKTFVTCDSKDSDGCKSDWWRKVKMGPPDVIIGITEAYKRDKDKKKVNLGVGAYRDDAGKPFILPCIRMAEDIIRKKKLNHEYAPIEGICEFTEAAAKVACGDCCPMLNRKSNCTVQTISGTGALRVGLDLVSKYFTKKTTVWLSSPTWGNHPQICNMLGLKVKRYRYLDPKTNSFNLKATLEDICKIPKRSIIIFQPCAHNPTGVDPKCEEWGEISKAVKERKLLPFFDMAYQGFATGNIDKDAAALRIFIRDGNQIMLAQSFAKSMGLYGQRAGTLTLDCGDEKTAAKVMSQVKILIRAMYSSPPLYGARLAQEVLTNQKVKKQWLCDIKHMSGRIIKMRNDLRTSIECAGNKRSWKHITDQNGIFCYTGLNAKEVERLTKEFHIYLTKDGRISVAGITSKNVQYVANAIHSVTS